MKENFLNKLLHIKEMNSEPDVNSATWSFIMQAKKYLQEKNIDLAYEYFSRTRSNKRKNER